MINNKDFFDSFDEDHESFHHHNHHMGGFARGGHHGLRMGHGDIAPNVLKALEERPMHGYELIQYFEQKSYGFWRPSSGSIYPILQSLEDQELVKSHDENGKKVYGLTEAGKEKLKKEPWGKTIPNFEERMKRGKRIIILKGNLKSLLKSIRDIGMNGSDKDVEKTKEILEKAVEELNKRASEVHDKD
jgi:DNA-binding PadR family transcriptional regulator